MRRPFGRHDLLPRLTAAWHRSRFCIRRQRRRNWPPATPPPAPPAQRSGRLRSALWSMGLVAVSVLALGLIAQAASWSPIARPPLEAASDLSVTVLDRNDRLLRAYTTADGRWRLPIEPAQVDRRYLSMLIDFEDKRFHNHHGVDLWAVGRAAWQLDRKSVV